MLQLHSREQDLQLFLASSQPRSEGQGVKLWPEGVRKEERDPGVAVGARTRCLWRSRMKLAGERGKIAELGQTTFSYAKSTSFLPNYSPKFLLPHREQECFICQWILAMGDLNSPACHWYGHVEPSFSTHGSARAGEGWSGSPLSPSVYGTSSPHTHTSCCIWPQHSKTEGQCQAGTTSFVLGASNKLPLSCGGIMHVPPRREGWRRGSMPGGHAALAPSAAQPAAARPHT